MGGSTIASIINRNINKIKYMNYILIQPNAYSKDIRKYLYDKQFHVEKEDVIYSKGIYYEYILILPKQQENLDKEYINFWCVLIMICHYVFFNNAEGKYNDFIKYKINKYKGVLFHLRKNKLSNTIKYETFSRRIEILGRFLL